MKKKHEVTPWMYLPLVLMLGVSITFAENDAQASKTVVLIEETAFPVQIIVEETEAVKTANFEVVEDEQETVEETDSEEHLVRVECNDSVQVDVESVEENRISTESEEVETEVETAPIYTYKGIEKLSSGVQEYLWEEWNKYDLPEEWYPYIIGLIYQECSFNINSVHVNADGSRDIGYFQYNTKWWSGTAAKFGFPNADINNPYDQVWVFVHQTYQRYSQGLSLEECLSRHRRGDYDGYDAEYVRMVKERTARLVRA